MPRMTLIALPLLLALAWLPAAAHAQQADAGALLPAWEQLSEAQRDLLVAPIRERWNRAPAERQRMLQRAERWQSLTPEQRQRAHRGMQRYEHMDAGQRAHARALYHAMRGMDAAQRKAFLAEWKSKSADQRRAWLEAHPAPARGQRPND